jgi:two-component system cell cycle sensor histidine kinase/response regulator CckA
MPPGSYVYLGVADTGVGMTQEVQRHIFEPFFTTKDPDKGTGLGLATVYGIVSQSGGHIRVQSEPARGAAFHIYLPRTDASAVVPEAAIIMEATPHGAETVLIVEDEDAVRQLAVISLERYGYRVLSAATGSEAIQLAAEYSEAIHLLLTDVVMPRMNGRVLSEQIRNVRPDIKVLYISGYSEEIITHQAVLDAGVVYLAKPFNPDVLAAKVREILTEGRPNARAMPASGG